MVTLGYYIKFSRFAGAYPPPNTSSTGGSLRPLVRRGPVSPNNVLEKKKVCVLGKVCGHLASASELNLGQFGARGGASSVRVLPIPPFDQKSKGYTSLRSFPSFSPP